MDHNPFRNPPSESFKFDLFQGNNFLEDEKNSIIQDTSLNQSLQNSFHQKSLINQDEQSLKNSVVSDQSDFLNDDIYRLIAEEEVNLENYSNLIEQNKIQINRDLNNFTREINNHIKKLQQGLENQLDNYKNTYFQKYEQFKEKLMELKELKLQEKFKNKKKSNIEARSNVNLLRDLEDLQHQNQIAKLLNQLHQQQQVTIQKLNQIGNNILDQQNYSQNLYRQNHLNEQLSKICKQTTELISNMEPSEFVKQLKSQELKIHKHRHINTQQFLCVQHFDQNNFALGTKQGTIFLVNFQNQVQKTLNEHTASVLSLCKINSNTLASGSDHGDQSIIIWNLKNESVQKKLINHQAAVINLQYLVDKNILISASYDKQIRLWNLDNYNCLQVLNNHTGSITCMIQDQERIFSGSLNKEIFLWKVQKNEFDLKRQSSECFKLGSWKLIRAIFRLLKSTLTLYGLGMQNGSVILWNLVSYQMIKEWDSLDVPIADLHFITLQQKSFLLTFYENQLRVTDIQGNKHKKVDLQQYLNLKFSCAISPKIQIEKLNSNHIVITTINQLKSLTQWNISI